MKATWKIETHKDNDLLHILFNYFWKNTKTCFNKQCLTKVQNISKMFKADIQYIFNVESAFVICLYANQH